jgi:hypothetical protein
MAVIHNGRRLIDPTASFRHPIMEMVNGTFGHLPQVRRLFGEELPQFSRPSANFEDL